MKVTMKKVQEFEGFNAKEFCVKPSYWGYPMVYSYEAKDIMEEAKKLADSVDGVCIAIVEDAMGPYVLGESCTKGLSSKFVLFNAVECDRVHAEMRAITFNTGCGALSNYWYDSWIRYQKGSIA